MRARRDGALVSVTYLTTGVPPREQLWRWQRAGYRSRGAHQRDDAGAAAALQNYIAGAARALRWSFATRLLNCLDAAVTSVEQAIVAVGATELWVTAFEGAHQDHDAANALAASFREHLPVWEFAAYNFARGRVVSNRLLDARGGAIEIELDRDEIALPAPGALGLYASERG